MNEYMRTIKNIGDDNKQKDNILEEYNKKNRLLI